MPVEMPDILARICADTRTETERRKTACPLDEMRRRAEAMPPPRPFAAALRQAAGRGPALIAEIKRASPSGGLLRPEYDPAVLARAYAEGGAACLSVLTDGPYFQGEAAHLRAARDAVALPVLRKDFLLEPWQVAETRAMGGDCILLIMAALTDAEAAKLEAEAERLGMDVLSESHDETELRRALRLRTRLIGVNNRDLRTLVTDLDTTIRLAPEIPPDRLLIAESGVLASADIVRLRGVGAKGFLVGESLLRQPDVRQATRLLLGAAA